MKTIFLSFFAIALLDVLPFSCGDKDSKQYPSVANGGLISSSDCKNNKVLTAGETPDSVSCVEYSYDAGTMKLNLMHINAGFNCCPGDLTCEVTLSGDTIIIEESEETPQCNCDCLFDLEIGVNEVNATAYHIKFIEPYVENQPKILFDIDLSDVASGSYCVTRTSYPWGVGLF